MEIVKIGQRSEEWFNIRKGKMTASHAQAIQANGKGLETYIHNLMAEYYSKFTESYTNEAMQRGIELEAQARFAYEMESGLSVVEVGFVIMDDYVGASPDGLTEDRCVEIKCPQNPEYFRMLLGGDIKPEYKAQIQMQIMVCEKDLCDFVVYNPNYEKSIIIITVEKDEKMQSKLLAGIETGKKLIDDIKAKMS